MNYKTLIEIVRKEFPKAPYFNDKRKNHRRIKFFGKYGKKDTPLKIYNYLKKHYPSLDISMTENRDEMRGPKLYYSGCIVKIDL